MKNLNKYQLADALLSADKETVESAISIAKYHCPALYAERIESLEGAIRSILDSVIYDSGKSQINISYNAPEILRARKLLGV